MESHKENHDGLKDEIVEEGLRVCVDGHEADSVRPQKVIPVPVVVRGHEARQRVRLKGELDDDHNQRVNDDELPVLLARSAFFVHSVGEDRDGVHESDQISVLNHGDDHEEIHKHVEVGDAGENDALDQLPNERVDSTSFLCS